MKTDRRSFYIAAGVALAFFTFVLGHQLGWRQATARYDIQHGTEVRIFTPPLEILFSQAAGFYAESFYLGLYAKEGAEIFFTLDGSAPNAYSERFAGQIFVEATEQVRVFNISAVAKYGDEISETVTQNFVVGRDVRTRFCENTLIFALNSCPHGLFDHYDGIFVPGIDREIFRQEYYEEHGRMPRPSHGGYGEAPDSPANFNRRGRESERAVHVQVFDSAGELHVSQRAGLRVRGGFSRAIEPQKSIELFARASYGDRSDFPFAFFPDEFSADGRLIDSYRRVRLRNGGTDRLAGFIRDELSQSLFRQAGHTTTQTHRPAAIFLNGEYYGVAWLKTPRTTNHLSQIFGGDENNFEIVAGGDRRFISSWWTGEDRSTADLYEISELVRYGLAGENGDSILEEFRRRIDVDALIRYYAMQIFINNYDWPNHNIEMWRYFPTEEEQADQTLHPYLRDGRWRVFTHDLEAGWAIWDDYGRMQNEDTLRDILTGENHHRWNSNYSSAFLYAFVSHAETRTQLANAFEELIDGAFSPQNIITTLDALIAQIENEHNYAMLSGIFNPQNEWWPSPESMAYSRDAIRRFAHARPYVIQNSIDYLLN
ncbi:MAG: CotH kinase family protein [Defluviitaleaceae bacterium]|nr:CotH kinase family protein [Defluviitaleaceae bacterium]MCL2262727.1 CotH kinase family protein [Defluviitaleaceae bacterium]